jgi:hypothetical protein
MVRSGQTRQPQPSSDRWAALPIGMSCALVQGTVCRGQSSMLTTMSRAQPGAKSWGSNVTVEHARPVHWKASIPGTAMPLYYVIGGPL